MKKYFLLAAIISGILILSDCSSSKKIVVPKTTYTADVSTVIMNNCSPCHIPAKRGFKKAYDNYFNVKTDIDEIIRRIQLNPGEKDFMPFKRTVKLNDSTVAVFKKWRDDGLLEN